MLARVFTRAVAGLAVVLVPAALMGSVAAAAEKVPEGAKFYPSGNGSWRSGCNHYQNRARFLSREGDIEFVVLLAEACSAAEKSLDSRREAERLAAMDFLEKVVALRDTLVDMNMRRVYGDTENPWAKPVFNDYHGGRTIEISRVGKWGEFLIAHRMGVFSAYDAWLDSGTDFSIAFVK
ncbi:hypothetical protein KHP62_05815 [Rhodobacteraceae bacterium NNCM2]|nr:hypothetical protein [Coraliihabitans acroporae]